MTDKEVIVKQHESMMTGDELEELERLKEFERSLDGAMESLQRLAARYKANENIFFARIRKRLKFDESIHFRAKISTKMIYWTTKVEAK